MSCGCACWRKPRYKRLIDSLFPEDPQDSTPVASNMDKLLYFARSSPEHLDSMGEYLTSRVRRSLQRERRGHTCVALKITERLISECDERRIQLIADSYLEILHAMLESTHTDVQIMATNSFVMFAEREEGNAPYHRQYDFFIHRFASLSLMSANKGGQNYKETRMTGLKGLRGVIKKIGSQDGPQLNIWAIDHMNKIVPPFLFNMQDDGRQSSEIQNESEANLASYAEQGLIDLVQCAGLANIDSVIKPVLQHFDLNKLWVKKREFSAGVFVLIVETMQKQDRYKAIQSLVDHLDANAKESCDLKQGILDTLSQCVAVAADGSLGPSVLDVFRTLVKHLRISIEGDDSSSEHHQLVTSQDSQQFQESITKTVGEFAGVLPDYHKPDIMNLINSYMPSGGDAVTMEIEIVAHPLAGARIESHALTTSLVKCLKAVADTYHPAILETTFPDALFKSLVQLFTISEPSIQLDVLILWHQLIDHHDNKHNIPLHTDWESLESTGLALGKVSDRFIHQTSSLLYTSLYEHAKIVSTSCDNLVAFYQLLCLLTLELSHPGLNDMMSYLSRLQDLAVEGDSLSLHHRTAMHAIIAGVLHLICQVSTNAALEDHVNEVIGLRRELAPHLLPASVFGEQLEASGNDATVDHKLLFQLREENLLRKSPEPKKGFGPFHAESTSSGPDLTTHFSVSLDYGPDSPLSVDQISFNNLKERAEMVLTGESSADVLFTGDDEDESQGIPILTTDGSGHGEPELSFEEALKGASKESSDINGLDISAILSKASSPTKSVPIPAREHTASSGSAYDMELPSLH